MICDDSKIKYSFFDSKLSGNFWGNEKKLNKSLVEKYEWEYGFFFQKKTELSNILDAISFQEAYEAVSTMIFQNYSKNYTNKDFIELFGEKFDEISARFHEEYNINSMNDLLDFFEKEGFEEMKE